eukprot:c13208_g1_i1.p1 GENE.c13208_g1_i1~~c13208_g1_i1.p1  ORF type:complete len:218 (+),score=32.78 c13208_g1_i1:55-708(+)
MTLFHFCNCVALAYAPALILYRTKVAEAENFWKCAPAVMAYLITQLAKMILMATFMASGSAGFHPLQELMRALISLLDFVGLHYALNNSGKGSTKELKIMLVTLGWSQTENILSNLVFFWNGARGKEFDWQYLFQAVEANINLVIFLAITSIVFHVKKGRPSTSSLIGIALYTLSPVITSFLQNFLVVGYLPLIIFHAAVAVGLSVFGWSVFTQPKI